MKRHRPKRSIASTMLPLVCSLLAAFACCRADVPAQKASKEDLRKGPHTGDVDQAVVAVEVRNTSADGQSLPVRRGAGFILRCDGFILVPSDLVAITRTGASEYGDNQTITIVTKPGTDREKRISGRRRPRYTATGLGYATMKLDAFHQVALRTMLPDTLKPGDVVTVCWPAWDETGKGYAELKRTTARIGKTKEGSPGWITFEQSIEGVAAGAVVMGPEGMCVGMVPGGGTATRDSFLSFEMLHRATNCVSPVPTPDSVFHRTKPDADNAGPADRAAPEAGAAGGGDILKVPGGPTRLTEEILPEQPDMEREPIACMADFEIDKHEVTNAQYAAFWSALPEEVRTNAKARAALFPVSWADDPPYFGGELAGLPVVGVPWQGAAAYARSQGKRLATPYEWLRAAFGEDSRVRPPWVRQYIADRQAAWLKVAQAHILWLQQHPQARKELAGPGPGIPMMISLEFGGSPVAFSREVVETATAPLWALWKDPVYLLPVGSREFDRSPFGAEDMILNASELVLPSPAGPANGSMRYMEVAWLPKLNAGPGWHPNYPRFYHLTSGDHFQGDVVSNGTLKPLSRLYARVLFGNRGDQRSGEPFIDDWEGLLAWANICEAVAMLGPFEDWLPLMAGRVSLSTPNEYVTAMRQGTPLSQEVRRVWSGLLRHYRPEIGVTARTIPFLSRTPPILQRFEGRMQGRRGGTPRDAYFILPIGFRCAR